MDQMLSFTPNRFVPSYGTRAGEIDGGASLIGTAPAEPGRRGIALDSAVTLNELLVDPKIEKGVRVLRPMSRFVRAVDGLTGCYDFLRTVRQDLQEHGRVGVESLAAMFGAVAKSGVSSALILAAPSLIGAGALAGPAGAVAGIAVVAAGLYYVPQKACELAKDAVRQIANWF